VWLEAKTLDERRDVITIAEMILAMIHCPLDFKYKEK
tara:strand:+ start:18 stop:128 length:111 start_codon:yes stop_codon:yes gene_type:complete